MRIRTALAALGLAAAGLLGATGIATASDQGPAADYGHTQFVANRTDAGVENTTSIATPNGVEHHKSWIWADENGVSGSVTGGNVQQ